MLNNLMVAVACALCTQSRISLRPPSPDMRPAATRSIVLLSAADDDARMVGLERTAREATARASDAANAEARLRNMVATAEAAASCAVGDRLKAEDEASELREELEALRMLYTEDVAGLQETVDELRADGNDNGSGSASADVAEIAEIISERDDWRDRALRAEADRTDAMAECSAVQALAAEDVAARDATIEELGDELRSARAATAQAELDGGGEAGVTNRELRAQVAELMVALEASQEGAAELMLLRPKVAELERRLRGEEDGAGVGRPPSDGIMEMLTGEADLEDPK